MTNKIGTVYRSRIFPLCRVLVGENFHNTIHSSINKFSLREDTSKKLYYFTGFIEDQASKVGIK